MTDIPQDPKPLGSLAQAARSKNLSSARAILFVVGILTIVANLAFFFLAESQVNKALEDEVKKQGPGFVVDQAKFSEVKAQATKVVKLVSIGTVVLGVVFIILGIVVYKIPVIATVLGLVLYLGGNLIFGLFDPATLAKGAIIKILIIVGLAKAIQSAIAYQKEQTAPQGTGD